MVPLPLFKLAALFVRQVSKYGANSIKAQAHEHPRFRRLAIQYGQALHQINMRLSVSLLKTSSSKKAREKIEVATVKTKEQFEKEEAVRAKHGSKSAQASSSPLSLPSLSPNVESPAPPGDTSKEPQPAQSSQSSQTQSIWRRKFRPLPEAKAVDLFADVAGDAFILTVACALILYEYWKSSQKPDNNTARIGELNTRIEELQKRERELEEAEDKQRQRIDSLEIALADLKNSANTSKLQTLLSHANART